MKDVRIKRLSISNYETSELLIHNIPSSIDTDNWKEIEEYITEELGYNLSNIEWFVFVAIVQ